MEINKTKEMKIDDIKDPQIRALAWKYRKANKDETCDQDTVFKGFNWTETEEDYDFWNDVNRGNTVEITEKMKADHPEIFLKKEEMKTTRELENGTVLEVGKKYTLSDWRIECYYEILFLGEKCFLVKDEINREKAFEYPNWNQLIPYKEPKEKVKLTKFYVSDVGQDFSIKFYDNKNCAEIEWDYVYTEKEFLEKFDVEL